MYSGRDDAALPASGFPIRESTGHRPLDASPWLIAVVHALPRLLVPRHPPSAVHILTVIRVHPRGSRLRVPSGCGPDEISVCWPTCAVFKVRRGRNRGDIRGRSLKTQQHAATRGASCACARRPDPVDMLGPPPRPEGRRGGLPLLRVTPCGRTLRNRAP
jgi:hypothetical protein